MPNDYLHAIHSDLLFVIRFHLGHMHNILYLLRYAGRISQTSVLGTEPTVDDKGEEEIKSRHLIIIMIGMIYFFI